MNSILLAQEGTIMGSFTVCFLVAVSSVKILRWFLEYGQSHLMNELFPIPAFADSINICLSRVLASSWMQPVSDVHYQGPSPRSCNGSGAADAFKYLAALMGFAASCQIDI